MNSKIGRRQRRFTGLCISHRSQTEKLLPCTGKAFNRPALGTAKLKRTATRSAWCNTYELLARASKTAQNTALRTAKLERSARLAENERTAGLTEDEGITWLLELEGPAR